MDSDQIGRDSGIAGNTLLPHRGFVAPEIDALGWRRSARTEHPDHDLSITCIDAHPMEDVSLAAEGPAAFSVAVIREGAGSIVMEGGEPLDVGPGQAIVFSSTRPARGENRIRGGCPVRLIDIRFGRSFANQVDPLPLADPAADSVENRSMPETGLVLLGFPAPWRLVEIAAQIEACLFDNAMARRLFLRAKGLEALAVTIDFLAGRRADPESLDRQERTYVARARHLLDTRFEERWTIPLLARTLGLSEGKLKADFRRGVGVSIHAYLLNVRLDAAAGLLSGGASVTEAAYAAGFGNLSHFSKTFRNAKGVSPQDYGRGRRPGS